VKVIKKILLRLPEETKKRGEAGEEREREMLFPDKLTRILV